MTFFGQMKAHVSFSAIGKRTGGISTVCANVGAVQSNLACATTRVGKKLRDGSIKTSQLCAWVALILQAPSLGRAIALAPPMPRVDTTRPHLSPLARPSRVIGRVLRCRPAADLVAPS